MSEVSDMLEKFKTDIEAMFKSERAQLVPLMGEIAKAAVAASGNPIAAAVGPPVIDAVDMLVLQLTGGTAPANAVAAPEDQEARTRALEQHVAALTVATGLHNSVPLTTVKSQAVALDAVAHDATEA